MLIIQRLVFRARSLVKDLDDLVQNKLTTTKGSDRNDTPKVARFSWIKEKDNLARLQQKIRDTRQDLTLALTTTNVHISSEL